MIRYEHPLNERIRTLMRLEDLYQRAQYFAAQSHAHDHHAALLALFEITDVAARADLKTDILQELERQKQLLAPLRSNPAIEPKVLEPLLAEIDRVGSELLAQAGKVGGHLRENEWLMTIKQRAALPGGPTSSSTGELTGPASKSNPATTMPSTSAMAMATTPFSGVSVAKPRPSTTVSGRVTRTVSVSR